MRSGTFVGAIVAGLLHAILMGLAFPPVGWWGLALLAPTPLIWIACLHTKARSDLTRRRNDLVRLLLRWRVPIGVSLGVAPLWAYESQWVMNVSEAGYIPMVPGLALFAGVFVGMLSRVRERVPWMPLWMAAPVLWCGLEVFRGEIVVTGYAWLILGQPLISSLFVPMIASVVGMYGVSFLACIPASAACAIPLAQDRAVKVGVGVLCVLGVLGLAVPLAVGLSERKSGSAGGEARSLRIAVVQTNIPQDNKLSWTLEARQRDFARMLELTRHAATSTPKPDLIVWPETMFPGELLESIVWPDGQGGTMRRPLAGEMVGALFETQSSMGVPMMVGALGIDNGRIARGPDGAADLSFDARYNSVFLVDQGALDATRYDKMELTPFGEMMPYVHHWPWLERMVMGVAASGMKFDLTAGKSVRTFHVGGSGGVSATIVTPICFEITKTAHCRRLINESNDLAARGRPIIVNLSNDGWFGAFTGGKQQHLLAARWRAAELGVPIVRSVNTGISCFIDASGRVMKDEGAGPLASGVDGVITAEVRVPDGEPTIYARVGNVVGWGSLGASIVLGLLSVRSGTRARVKSAVTPV